MYKSKHCNWNMSKQLFWLEKFSFFPLQPSSKNPTWFQKFSSLTHIGIILWLKKILKNKREFVPAFMDSQAFPWISWLGTSREHLFKESVTLVIHCSKCTTTFSHYICSYCLKIYAHFLFLSSTVFYSEVLLLKNIWLEENRLNDLSLSLSSRLLTKGSYFLLVQKNQNLSSGRGSPPGCHHGVAMLLLQLSIGTELKPILKSYTQDSITTVISMSSSLPTCTSSKHRCRLQCWSPSYFPILDLKAFYEEKKIPTGMRL